MRFSRFPVLLIVLLGQPLAGLPLPTKGAKEAPRWKDGGSFLREAESLLIPEENYLLHFEDEEALGKVEATDEQRTEVKFSKSDVSAFQDAVRTIGAYRNYLKRNCPTSGSRALQSALDRYLFGIASFHERGLRMSGDITENNAHLFLSVNRTLLKDAPILISRHLQFKRQRFKDQLTQFSKSDEALVNALQLVSTTFKVSLGDADWSRTYTLRSPQIESVSLWPRELIFGATDHLGGGSEKACRVALPESKSPVPNP